MRCEDGTNCPVILPIKLYHTLGIGNHGILPVEEWDEDSEQVGERRIIANLIRRQYNSDCEHDS